MKPEERKIVLAFKKLSPERRKKWIENTTPQRRAQMKRLVQMYNFEYAQTARTELDKIMKNAGIEQGITKIQNESE